MEFSTILNEDMLNVSLEMPSSAIFFKLGLAAVLGIFISYVIRWTHWDRRLKKIRGLVSMQQAHIFLCVGGAFIMIIVGNSLAKAFGLTGALSVIRFRTNLIEPKDAAIIILVIAIGMAAGMGEFVYALLMTALMTLLLVAMYLQNRRLPPKQNEDQNSSSSDTVEE